MLSKIAATIFLFIFAIASVHGALAEGIQPTVNGLSKNFQYDVRPFSAQFRTNFTIGTTNSVSHLHDITPIKPNESAGILTGRLSDGRRGVKMRKKNSRSDLLNLDRSLLLDTVQQIKANPNKPPKPGPQPNNPPATNDQLQGSAQGDRLDAGAGNDVIRGLAGNDVILAGAGNDTIFGDDGDDLLVLSGVKSAYTFARLDDGGVRIEGPDGTDVVYGIERIAFGGSTRVSEQLAALLPKLPAGIGGTLAGQTTEDSTAPVSGALMITASDGARVSGQFLGATISGAYGTFQLSATGAWTYVVNTAAAQMLAAGANAVERFEVQTADGAFKQTISVSVAGLNDAARITGNGAATLTEDGGAIAASGKLTVADVDSGDAAVRAQSGIAGKYGTFSIGADGGWNYALNSAASQALAANQSAVDSFIVTSRDGSATSTVNVTVNGANDPATMSGTTAGEVTEDASLSTARGTITVIDPDAGQSGVQAQSNVAGQYGSFSIAADGKWVYQLNNANPNVQALGKDGTLSETFTVKSLDGSRTETVTVTVKGADETTSGGSTDGSTGGTTGGHDHGAGGSNPDTWPDYRADGLQASAFSSVSAFVAAVKAQAEMPSGMTDAKMLAEHNALLKLVPRGEATSVAVKDGSWFDPSTWADGKVPGNGAKVLIPQAMTVTYDGQSDASIFTLRIDGHLDFATDRNTKLEVDTMVVTHTGHLTIGTEDNPVKAGVTADIVFADNGAINANWDPMLLSRGLISQGAVEVHGEEKCGHLKVAVDPMKGDTQIIMQDLAHGCGCGCGANWKVGDKIVLTGTHYVPWGANGYMGTEDEVLTIKAIDGNVITIDRPLMFNHETPRDDLKAYVANYTRNVSFSTENADQNPVHERGHTMFMHSNMVDIRFAEFDELGRTDKSVRAVDASATNTDSDLNVKGRYSFHLHMTGSEPGSAEATVMGNAAWGSPGWGFAQHSSNALFQDNATFNTFGAGFVAEKGDEIGAWRDNIAIKAQGNVYSSPKDGADVEAFDLARGGEGFWLQGRLLELSGNIAAGVNKGFVWMPRGSDARPNILNMDQPEASRGLSDISHVPIQHFVDNEVMASWSGMTVIKANPAQGHDVRTILDGFKAWEVWQGAHIEYTSHYTLKNFDLIGTKSGESWGVGAWKDGISFGNFTYDMVVNNAKIEGFWNGLQFAKQDAGGNKHPEWGVVLIDVLSQNNGTNYATVDPRYDTILKSSDLKEGALSLKLPWQGTILWNGQHLELGDAIKTDSVGTTKYQIGTEEMKIWGWSMKEFLMQNGYFKTSDGKMITIIEEYFADRATGEIQKMAIPVQLAFLPWAPADWQPFPYKGIINLSSLAPLTGNDGASTSEGTPVTIDVLANDRDPDGDRLVVDGLTQPVHGKVVVSDSGALIYTPDHGFSGSEHFTYWASDNNGNFTRASVMVNVVEHTDLILQ